MSKDISHRVLKYSGKNLVEVCNGLSTHEAVELIKFWTDDKKGQFCICTTLDCNPEATIEEAERSESFESSMGVYTVSTSLGILVIVAKSSGAAKRCVEGMFNDVSNTTGIKLNVDDPKYIDKVSLILDEMGLMYSSFNQVQLADMARATIAETE